jgi:hypothetical protein
MEFRAATSPWKMRWLRHLMAKPSSPINLQSYSRSCVRAVFNEVCSLKPDTRVPDLATTYERLPWHICPPHSLIQSQSTRNIQSMFSIIMSSICRFKPFVIKWLWHLSLAADTTSRQEVDLPTQNDDTTKRDLLVCTIYLVTLVWSLQASLVTRQFVSHAIQQRWDNSASWKSTEGKQRLVHRLSRFWSRSYRWIVPWKPRIGIPSPSCTPWGT